MSAAIQVGVDTIGLNSLAGAHSTLFTKVLNFLKDKGVSDILVYTGGIIPRDDA